jgi:hypothetical protein
MFLLKKYIGRQHFFSSRAKMNGDLYRFNVAESKYGNRNSLASTILKGERFKINKYVLNKKN